MLTTVMMMIIMMKLCDQGLTPGHADYNTDDSDAESDADDDCGVEPEAWQVHPC